MVMLTCCYDSSEKHREGDGPHKLSRNDRTSVADSEGRDQKAHKGDHAGVICGRLENP